MPLAKPTKPDAITAVPTPVPLRTDRANFAARGDAMMGWFPDGIDEINDTSDYMDDAANFAEQEANEAEASATAAAASNAAAAVNAAAAAASAGATVWVTGTTYAAGVVRYSPTNFQTYRDTVGGLSNTDPASDTSGRWISAMLPSVEAIGLPAMPPTAVFNFASGVIDRRFVESRSTAGTRYNIFGNLETLAAGIAKPTYDPATNEAKGYLAEPAATNLLLYSEDLSTGWIAGGATVAANATRAPDGNTTADKIVESATTAQHFFYQLVTVASGPFTFSVCLKAAERSVAYVLMSDNSTGAAGVRVDLSTGTLSSDGATAGLWTSVTSTIEPLADGYYRVSVSGIRGAGTQTAGFILMSNGSGTSSGDTYAGDGTSGLYAWGAQIEAGLTATSYIATGSGTESRTAGGLTLDLTTHAAIVNPAGFTFVCAFDYPAIDGSTKFICCANDGSGITYIGIDIYNATVYAQAVIAGVDYGSPAQTSLVGVGERIVVAASFGDGEVRLVQRGGVAVTTALTAALPAFTKLGVGGVPGDAVNYRPGKPIELIAVFPRACTAGELRAFVNNY